MILLLTGLVVGILLIVQQQQQGNSPLQISTPAPSTGGVYTEALIGSFKRLNPILDSYNQPDQDVDQLLFSSLVRFDERGLPQPDLAESWGYSQDGTLYNVSLRPGMVWHDGQPLTADDVLFTISLLKTKNALIPSDISAFWNDVQVKKFSNTQLQFRLPEAFSPFLNYLTFKVLPKHLLENVSLDAMVNSPFDMNPVGSGPYRFNRLMVENGKITGVVLDLFNKYYAKKPFIQRIVFRYYPDGQSAFTAYQAGDVQGVSRITADVLPAALKDANLALFSGRLPSLTLIYLNLNNPEVPFFKDANFRRALLTAINRPLIIKNVLQGQGEIANGPILPGTWAYDSSIEKINYDPVAVSQLLNSAGYTSSGSPGGLTMKDGTPVKFTLLYPEDPTHEAIAQIIKSDWEAMGANVSLDAQSYDTILNDRLDQRVYQAALVEINYSNSPDPDPYPFWDQGQATGGQNYSQWQNKTASEYLEQARVVNDIDERARYYRNFQVLFSQDLPALPLFYPIYTYGVDKAIQGVQMGPLYSPCDRFDTISDWYLVSNRQSGAKTTSTPKR